MPRQDQRHVDVVPRFALSKQEAAAALGMTVKTFQRRVQPNVKSIRVGQLVYFRPAELERWTRENERYTA